MQDLQLQAETGTNAEKHRALCSGERHLLLVRARDEAAASALSASPAFSRLRLDLPPGTRLPAVQRRDEAFFAFF
jgi:hypothetical protein